jgi:probable rRNA maturation factor
MSLSVDVSTEGARSPLGRARVMDVARATLEAEGVREAMVSITFVDKKNIAKLNAEHLSHRGPTDVISFGFTRATTNDPVVGDIYICPDVAREHAIERDEPVRREIARLVVHGLLHVLGHDHPLDERRESSPMWIRQERLLARLKRRALL